jgi:hypothetical protein
MGSRRHLANEIHPTMTNTFVRALVMATAATIPGLLCAIATPPRLQDQQLAIHTVELPAALDATVLLPVCTESRLRPQLPCPWSGCWEKPCRPPIHRFVASRL